MPITPQYEWDESEQVVEVRVSLPGASKSKSDVFATDCMVKVNLAPYLLVLDLSGEVDPTRTIATFTTPSGVTFRLFKRQPGLWGRLEAQGGKEELTRRRNASIDRAHAFAEEQRKARLERKQKEARAAVDRQIELERLKRAEIERRKKAELDAERDSLQAWQQQLTAGGTQQGSAGDESDYEDEETGENEQEANEQGPVPDHPDYYGRGWRPNQNKSGKASQSGRSSEGDSDGDSDQTRSRRSKRSTKAAETQHAQHTDKATAPQETVSVGDRPCAPAKEDDSWRPLPPPRLRLEPVKVEFTALEMPHLPAREQREEELRAYKKGVARDRALLADSQDVSDRQPAFLKDKGDGLFKQGNYRGALAAYSRAIELDPEVPLLWSNRAAAHAKLGDHSACVDDCSQALDLLRQRTQRFESGVMESDELTAYKRQLTRVLVRRGAACAALGRLTPALTDYEEAIKYDPDNVSLQRDLEELRASLAPPDTHTLKARGAARYSAGDWGGAAEAFTLLIKCLAPGGSECVSALSNRAAAYLAAGDYLSAQKDCCLGLAMSLHTLTQHCTTGDRGTGSGQEALCSLCDAAGRAWGFPPPHASVTHPGSKSESEAADTQLHTWLQSLDPDTISTWLSERTPSQCGTQAQEPSATTHAASAQGGSAAGTESGVGAADTEPNSSVGSSACVGSSDNKSVGQKGDSGSGSVPCENAKSVLASIGRLLTRRAAVLGHLREYAAARRDFESAARVVLVTGGDAARREALLADAAKMEALCGQVATQCSVDERGSSEATQDGHTHAGATHSAKDEVD